MIHIVCINKTTLVGPEKFLTWTAACARQLRNEFAEAYDLLPPTVEAAREEDIIPMANLWEMSVWDNSTMPGAAGYHDIDATGKPRGFVFLDNPEPSVVFSHELCEMLKDPWCNAWVQTADGRFRAEEACDAVEGDSYPVMVGDEQVLVSNFVTPEYFAAVRTEGLKTDYLDKLGGKVAPALLPGGYDIVVGADGQVSQEFAAHMLALDPARRAAKGSPYSRTSRLLAKVPRPRELA